VSSANVIETSSLGKRYGRFWALRECTFSAPEGHLAALVGPNGAGKTTLLHLLVGLMTATAGTVTVLGGQPAGSRAALDGITRSRGRRPSGWSTARPSSGRDWRSRSPWLAIGGCECGAAGDRIQTLTAVRSFAGH
jgi:energy-coupling factor transporter ATP-binding protein EcfA2